MNKLTTRCPDGCQGRRLYKRSGCYSPVANEAGRVLCKRVASSSPLSADANEAPGPGNSTMFMSIKLLPSIRQVLGALLLTLGLAGVAEAQVFSFNTFLSGGGGGGDPQKQKVARQQGAFICLTVGPAPEANTVRFTVFSKTPQPRSRITSVAFDLGRHAGLFQSVAVAFASPGAKGQVVSAQQLSLIHI